MLEFRHIVSQKLGLNISSVPLGEYEYVASIEDAINSSQMNGIMTLQQAQSQSLVDALSARPCHTCPSWSSCEACHSKCQCSCLCERHRAPLLEGSKYSCSNDKAININNISEKTFKYNWASNCRNELTWNWKPLKILIVKFLFFYSCLRLFVFKFFNYDNL